MLPDPRDVHANGIGDLCEIGFLVRGHRNGARVAESDKDQGAALYQKTKEFLLERVVRAITTFLATFAIFFELSERTFFKTLPHLHWPRCPLRLLFFAIHNLTRVPGFARLRKKWFGNKAIAARVAQESLAGA